MATGRNVNIKPQAVMFEVRGKGVSFTCASCLHYWQGKDAGLGRCTGAAACGSPLVGDVFHDYDGPLTEDHFGRACFMCGSPPQVPVRVRGKQRLLALCEEHFDVFLQSAPLGAELQGVLSEDDVIFEWDRRVMTLREYRMIPRKKGVLEQIADIDGYLDDKERADAVRKVRKSNEDGDQKAGEASEAGETLG